MGWTINGVPHTGQILTVGPSGRDFSSLLDAVGASVNGALLLIDPGMYLCNTHYGLVTYGAWRYLRGLGTQPGDTIIRNTDSSEETVFAGDGIIENLMIDQRGTDPRSCIAYNANLTTSLIVSKCRLDGQSYTRNFHTSIWNRYALNGAHGTVTARYCDFARTLEPTFGGHFNGANTYNMYLSKMHVHKCVMPGRAAGQYVSGGFAELDRVTEQTVGYGSNYGDFLITEGGGTIAAIEQYYRRLRNG